MSWLNKWLGNEPELSAADPTKNLHRNYGSANPTLPNPYNPDEEYPTALGPGVSFDTPRPVATRKLAPPGLQFPNLAPDDTPELETPSLDLNSSYGSSSGTGVTQQQVEKPDPRGTYNNLRDKLMAALGQETESEQAYKQHLANRPEYQNAGLGRRIAAMLISAAQGAQGDTAGGIGLGQKILDFPNQERQKQWQFEGEKLGEAARLDEAKQRRELTGLQFGLGEAGKDIQRQDMEADKVERRALAEKQFGLQEMIAQQKQQQAAQQMQQEQQKFDALQAYRNAQNDIAREQNKIRAGHLQRLSQGNNSALDTLRSGKVNDTIDTRVAAEIATSPRYRDVVAFDEYGNPAGPKEGADPQLYNAYVREVKASADMAKKSGQIPSRFYQMILENQDEDSDPYDEVGE